MQLAKVKCFSMHMIDIIFDPLPLQFSSKVYNALTRSSENKRYIVTGKLNLPSFSKTHLIKSKMNTKESSSNNRKTIQNNAHEPDRDVSNNKGTLTVVIGVTMYDWLKF